MLGFALFYHLRGELRAYQDHVGADRLQAIDSLAYSLGNLGYVAAAQQGVGPDLPKHQVWFLGDHVMGETRQHFRRLLASDAALHDSDRDLGKARLEFDLEPARI